MSNPHRLVIASGNRNKAAEIAMRLGGLKCEVSGMADHGAAPEVAETEPDFRGNARLKAQGIATWLRSGALEGPCPNDLVIADDSGISIDVLDGAPGVYSARFAGVGASDADNNARMVRELAERGVMHSPAHYTCVLAIAPVMGEWPAAAGDLSRFAGRFEAQEGAYEVAVSEGCLFITGLCEGEVRRDAVGTGGFGYDPHFWPRGRDTTFAEIDRAEKLTFSHRGRALAGLRVLLAELLPSIVGA